VAVALLVVASIVIAVQLPMSARVLVLPLLPAIAALKIVAVVIVLLVVP